MFGKKKIGEQQPSEEPKTEIIDVKGQSSKAKMPEPPIPTLGALLWAEFVKDYSNHFGKEDMTQLSCAEVEALKLNLLIAIYGELRLIRDSTKQ